MDRVKELLKTWWTKNDHLEFSFMRFIYLFVIDLIKLTVLFLIFLYVPIYTDPDMVKQYFYLINDLEDTAGVFYIVAIYLLPFVFVWFTSLFDRSYVIKSEYLANSDQQPSN